MNRTLLVATVLGVLVAACSPESATETSTTSTIAPTTTITVEPLPPLELTSRSFEEGQSIPARFSCDGPNVNPPLDITGLPEGTVTLTLIMDDPDAPVGVWDHWVEYDIEANSGDYSIRAAAGQIGVEGLNSWNLPGYGGPCPPEGEEHRYFFTVYVLSDHLDLPPEIDSAGVRSAMEGKVIAEVALMGRYAR